MPLSTPDQVIKNTISTLEGELTSTEKTIRVTSKTTQHIRSDISELNKLSLKIVQAVKLFSEQIVFIKEQKDTLKNFDIDVEKGPVSHISPSKKTDYDDKIKKIDDEIIQIKNDLNSKNNDYTTAQSDYNQAMKKLNDYLIIIENLQNETNKLLNQIAEMNALKKKIEDARNNKQNNYLYFWYTELHKKITAFSIPQPTPVQYEDAFVGPLNDFITQQQLVRENEEKLNGYSEEVAVLEAKWKDLEKNRVINILKSLEGL
ncbi:MAG: hypothetical protein APR53_02805 [Methanoculleus sp. SDB]|nr:MAG: hypothetical protein APR53_02805 [Methanoculleus sp. SDB]